MKFWSTVKTWFSRSKGKSLKWFLLGCAVGAIALLLIFLLFRSGWGVTGSPPAPDTLTLLIIDTVPDTLTDTLYLSSGRVDPTVDSFYRIPRYTFLPNWRIHELVYRNRTLKLNAVKISKDTGQAECEAYSATYFAPGDFHLSIRGDSIRVDTFPAETEVSEIPEEKRKVFWWDVGLGAAVSTADSTLTPRMCLIAGCELGPLNIGKTQLGWRIAELEFVPRNYFTASSYLHLKF